MHKYIKNDSKGIFQCGSPNYENPKTKEVQICIYPGQTVRVLKTSARFLQALKAGFLSQNLEFDAESTSEGREQEGEGQEGAAA